MEVLRFRTVVTETEPWEHESDKLHFTLCLGTDGVVMSEKWLLVKGPILVEDMASLLRGMADSIEGEKKTVDGNEEHKDTLETLTLNHQFNHL